MKSFYLQHVVVLLSLAFYVLALPPITPSLTSTNLFSPHNVSSSTLTAFPPGRSPWSDYVPTLPNTSPVIEVTFRYFEWEPSRSESEVAAVFHTAIQDAGNPEISGDVVPMTTWSWTESTTRLDFKLARNPFTARIRMTWHQFYLALQAADAFRTAYPSLDFNWQLRIRYEGYIGWGEGHLWNLKP